MCTASFENDVPPWLKHKDSGWVTAEYGMLDQPQQEIKEKHKGSNLEEQLKSKDLLGVH